MDDKDVAGLVLADGSVLDKDDIPNENQALKCFSCGQAVTGVYCSNCGQKNDDYRRSILRLVAEFIGSFTALESRIWRTWAALLFKPGKVARAFADGARVKWSSPIRVFLAISILLFGFLSLSHTQLVSLDINVLPKAGITKPHNELTNKDLRIKGAVRFFETQKKIDARNKSRNFDLIEKWIAGNNGLYLNVDAAGPKPSKTEETPEQARQKVLNELGPQQKQKPDSAITQTKTVAPGPDKMKNLFLGIIRNPTQVNATIYKWLPRIMFLMMPISMFIGILFIRGRGNALLYDHLIHAAYLHSVAFFLLFLGILLMKVFPGAFIAKTLFIILLIYLPLSLKRMFGRGWIKTIWASYGVGVIYLLFLGIIMSVVIGWKISELVTTMNL